MVLKERVAMELFPEELKYSETHEWVRKEEQDIVVIGITDHAQVQLGELVFVDLPDVGLTISAGDEICVLESVKAAADVYSPVSGKIVAINEQLEDAPGLVNSDAYGDGWLYKVQLKDIVEYDELLEANDYKNFLAKDED